MRHLMHEPDNRSMFRFSLLQGKKRSIDLLVAIAGVSGETTPSLGVGRLSPCLCFDDTTTERPHTRYIVPYQFRDFGVGVKLCMPIPGLHIR
jgi:hypothetical protein